MDLRLTTIHDWSRALLYAVGILLLAGSGGCSDEEAGYQCQAGGVDPRLVDCWISCDESGAFRSFGMQIQSDGNTFTLGVDWRDGSVAVSEESCSPTILRCACNDRIAWPMIPGDYDTLRFTITGDRLELMRQSPNATVQRYRRVALGDVITEPVSCSFTGVLGNETWLAPAVWPEIPVRALRATPGDSSLTLLIAGSRNFSAFLPCFRGVGSYQLGRNLPDGAAGIGHPCSDVAWDLSTWDDSLSTITITMADTIAGRFAGFLDLALRDGRGNTRRATGSFEGVLTQWK
ncbi:MAG: hypothetical protein WC824_12480 [Bacteroidota bacterium]|jgi:hypothetical protein